MIDRAPNDGEVLILHRATSIYDKAKNDFYRISDIRTVNGRSYCHLNRIKPKGPDGNDMYPMRHFTANKGRTGHGEWFFATSDGYTRVVCDKCKGSFVLTPGEEYRVICDECKT